MTQDTLTGADALVGTLADCGVTACFANPGTSEMHLVAALDKEPRIRSVLCLFEGIATGAADGFGRVSETPAMTLLHLGAGYLNGGANIHNAKRAFTPMINVIGDHATYHVRYDAPLTSNILGLAAPNSVWIKSVDDVKRAGTLAAESVHASMTGTTGPVSLILPADSAWNPGGVHAPVMDVPKASPASEASIASAAQAIKSAKKPMIIINGDALSEAGLSEASRLQAAGVRVMTDTFVWKQARGAGRFAPDRMQYFAEGAMADLEDTDLMVICGTQMPVAFFAYPDKPSVLVPEGCEMVTLGGPELDVTKSISMLADELGASEKADVQPRTAPDKPTGALTPVTVGASVSRHMPAGSLVSDDGVTASLPIFMSTVTAEPHDWMMLTGGAIGQGMPLAVGAAVAKPEAKTICLSGDGAGMYTMQALWTMAREQLNVVTIVFVNHSYRILNIELKRTGAGDPGPTAQNMLNIGTPEIDWASLAKAQGVNAENASTAEEFDEALERALSGEGPTLIAAHMAG
ncbi:acetolactate synthase large subunit [Ponticaulis sp.]|uniref:acetolactate synthase large subunit n=1 Tax=Ponticaulis sp. TaxID=2020902 RepID=UPI0025F829F2|nr:acetolactate synthase large subunit [Ponticaulis sp.]|tara:strand:+ start:20365 stop:21924 length:1560 start_codon:yes stop_codon:yes gene_type:complete